MYSNTEEFTRPETLIGKTVAERYEIIDIIGQGGIGVVYKAKHTFMDRLVAIKMLRSESLRDERNWQRFQQEAQAISSLKHPNIVSVFDFGFNEGKSAYLVMDYLDGKDLDTLIQESGYLTPEEVVPIFTQICRALSETHKRNIIHRDLKPGNIIIVKEADKPQAKLVDFGMVKFDEHSEKRSQALTQPGEVFGSPYYMSPEQCTGMKLDARTDIYSMGVLMYEALTGRPPFLGENMVELAKMHIYDKPEALGPLINDKDFPVEMQKIVFKALEKNANDRYQTTEELEADLQAFNKHWLHKTGGESKPISLRQTTTSRRMKDEVMAAVKLAAEKQQSQAKQAAAASPAASSPAPAAATVKAGVKPWILMLLGIVIGCGLTFLLVSTMGKQDAHGSHWQDLIRSGESALNSGNLAEAEFNFSQAVQQAEKNGDTSDPAFIQALNGLASVYEKENKGEMAESIYKQTISRIEKKQSPDAVELAPVLLKIASLYSRLNRLDEAESMHKRAQYIIEKGFGPEDARSADYLLEYAALKRKQGAEDTAKAMEARANELKKNAGSK